MKIKKVLAFILALTMMLGMSTVALAEAEPALTNEGEGQVIDTALTASEAEGCEDCGDCEDCTPSDAAPFAVTSALAAPVGISGALESVCADCDGVGCDECEEAPGCNDCGDCYECNGIGAGITAASTPISVTDPSQFPTTFLDGDVINIDAPVITITNNVSVVAEGSVTLNLNGNTLNIEQGIFVLDTNLNVVGPGTLNISRPDYNGYALLVVSSTLQNTNAAINVDGGMSVHTGATATVTSVIGILEARPGLTPVAATVSGNVTGAVFAIDTAVNIGGNVTYNASVLAPSSIPLLLEAALVANRGANVTVNGNVNSSATGVWVNYEQNMETTVTVNGTITAPNFIHFGADDAPSSSDRSADQYDSIVIVNGISYRKYTSTIGTAIVTVLVRTPVVAAGSITEGLDAALQNNQTLVLGAGANTNITAANLQAIKANGGVLDIQLPNGVHISINAKDIGDNPQPIDLGVTITPVTAVTNVGGAQVPANSIIINPAAHGQFGFTLTIHIPASMLTSAGLTGNINLYYIATGGAVTNYGAITLQSDGSAIVSITHASQYVLSATAPTRGGGAPQTGDERSLLLPILSILFGTLGITGWVVYSKRLKITTN